MNVPAVALFALFIAIAAMAGVVALGIWALDAKPAAIRHRRARRAFICPCGHDFVFHQRGGHRACTRKGAEGYASSACSCQGYSGEIPPPELAELLRGGA